MNDDPESLRVRIVQAIDDGRRHLSEPPSAWPTARQVQRLRDDLDRLREVLPEQARELGDGLELLVSDLGSRCKDVLGDAIASLEKAAGRPDPPEGWQAEANSAQRWLSQLESLRPELVGEIREQLEKTALLLAGNQLVRDARQDLESTKTRLLRLEREGDFARLREEALDLRDRVEALHRQDMGRRDRKMPTQILGALGQLARDARAFWELKEEAYGTSLTHVIASDFQSSWDSLRRVQKSEGDTALVNYLPDERVPATEANARQIDVVTAIRVCELRWTIALNQRVTAHLENAEAKLKGKDVDPPGARKYLDEIDAPKKALPLERLGDDVKTRLETVRKRVKAAEKEQSLFVAAIGKAKEAQEPFRAWQSLQETGRSYAQFQKNTSEWHEANAEIGRKVTERSWEDLAEACSLIIGHSLDRAREVAQPIRDELEAYGEVFAAEVASATALLALMDELALLLAEASRRLEAPNTEAAAESLKAADGLLQKAQGGLPKQLVGAALVQQAEVRRLRGRLEAFTNAAQRLKSLTEDCRRPNTTPAKLHELIREIPQSQKDAPDRFRDDFAALLAYAEARYSLLAAKQILDIQGNREEALRLLEAAGRHQDFKAEAEAFVKLIETKLAKADARVRDAIADIRRLMLAGEYWRARSEALAVAQEPAEKGLRTELETVRRSCEEQVREESERLLREVLRTLEERAREENEVLPPEDPKVPSANPALLDQAVVRLKTLNATIWGGLASRLEPLIRRLKAEREVRQGKWLSAHRFYLEAARQIANAGDLELRAREGETRELAAAAFKQHVLGTWETMSSVDEAAQFLESQLRGEYHEDPDLLLARSRALTAVARRMEKSRRIDASPEAVESEERQLYRQVGAELETARRCAMAASVVASRWRMTGAVPEYESKRLYLLRREAEAEAAKRLEDVRREELGAERACRMADRKERILKLLAPVRRRQSR